MWVSQIWNKNSTSKRWQYDSPNPTQQEHDKTTTTQSNSEMIKQRYLPLHPKKRDKTHTWLTKPQFVSTCKLSWMAANHEYMTRPFCTGFTSQVKDCFYSTWEMKRKDANCDILGRWSKRDAFGLIKAKKRGGQGRNLCSLESDPDEDRRSWEPAGFMMARYCSWASAMSHVARWSIISSAGCHMISEDKRNRDSAFVLQ